MSTKTLTVTVHRVDGLPHSVELNTTDPYVDITYGGSMKRSKTLKDAGSCGNFEESFTWCYDTSKDDIELLVKTNRKMASDKTLAHNVFRIPRNTGPHVGCQIEKEIYQGPAYKDEGTGYHYHYSGQVALISDTDKCNNPVLNITVRIQ
ncbi:C2 domain protein [Gregarina niphandrodes]|uniref:C2 domain protein n=1 Tax=Gregarina niphandrodes TaxID=110365 RepID=A0A023B6S0_GRENI|nr:C2 domain protein [Gregarina niphandrodes]EZG66673.1 C2 domain protein [Gregarina niphandrodes]|eukprot:XP_011130524.1 C2 domain protein [Gregarina niphandrodes]